MTPWGVKADLEAIGREHEALREQHGAMRDAIEAWREAEAIPERKRQVTRLRIFGMPAGRPPSQVADQDNFRR